MSILGLCKYLNVFQDTIKQRLCTPSLEETYRRHIQNCSALLVSCISTRLCPSLRAVVPKWAVKHPQAPAKQH